MVLRKEVTGVDLKVYSWPLPTVKIMCPVLVKMMRGSHQTLMLPTGLKLKNSETPQAEITDLESPNLDHQR